jgi:hypothetical protein
MYFKDVPEASGPSQGTPMNVEIRSRQPAVCLRLPFILPLLLSGLKVT